MPRTACQRGVRWKSPLGVTWQCHCKSLCGCISLLVITHKLKRTLFSGEMICSWSLYHLCHPATLSVSELKTVSECACKNQGPYYWIQRSFCSNLPLLNSSLPHYQDISGQSKSPVSRHSITGLAMHCSLVMHSELAGFTG